MVTFRIQVVNPEHQTWWWHGMESFSTLLAICERNHWLWIPFTKEQLCKILMFPWFRPGQAFEQIARLSVIWDIMVLSRTQWIKLDWFLYRILTIIETDGARISMPAFCWWFEHSTFMSCNPGLCLIYKSVKTFIMHNIFSIQIKMWSDAFSMWPFMNAFFLYLRYNLTMEGDTYIIKINTNSSTYFTVATSHF